MKPILLTTVAALAVSVSARAQDVIYDTGPNATVLFNGAVSNLGWTSGFASEAQPQRWTAQPFSVTGPVKIEQIYANFFVPGDTPTDLNFIIWSRTGSDAPVDADMVASGGGAHSMDPLDPINTNVSLGAGDYYLTIYSSGGPNGDATIGWFTNAPNPIFFLDEGGLPWMWRSSMYPDPGFEFYQLSLDTLDALEGESRDNLYSAEFRLEGVIIPAPGVLALLGLAGLAAGRRRRR